MSFVLKAVLNGQTIYKKGLSAWTPDMQKARVFTRRCDASNARWYHPAFTNPEVVEVKLVEVPA